jgi:hypothetical protein
MDRLEARAAFVMVRRRLRLLLREWLWAAKVRVARRRTLQAALLNRRRRVLAASLLAWWARCWCPDAVQRPITETRIPLGVVKKGPKSLFCMPSKAEWISIILAMAQMLHPHLGQHPSCHEARV